MDSNNGLACYSLGSIYYNMALDENEEKQSKFFDKAIKYYRKAVALDENDTDYKIALGDALYYKKEFVKAAEMYSAVLKLNSNNDEAYYNLGLCKYELTKFEEAIVCYKKAIAINNKNPDYFNDLGNSQCALKRYDEALKSFQNALTMSQDPNFYQNLGNLYCDMRKYDEAIKCYKNALKSDPNHPDYHLNLGDAYRCQKKLIPALHHTLTSIDIKPQALNYLTLAQIFHEYKCYELAIKFYQQSLEHDPNNEAAIGNLRVCNEIIRKKKIEEENNGKSGDQSDLVNRGKAKAPHSTSSNPSHERNNGKMKDLEKMRKIIAEQQHTIEQLMEDKKHLEKKLELLQQELKQNNDKARHDHNALRDELERAKNELILWKSNSNPSESLLSSKLEALKINYSKQLVDDFVDEYVSQSKKMEEMRKVAETIHNTNIVLDKLANSRRKLIQFENELRNILKIIDTKQVTNERDLEALMKKSDEIKVEASKLEKDHSALFDSIVKNISENEWILSNEKFTTELNYYRDKLDVNTVIKLKVAEHSLKMNK
jgi:tetratricopeptide (TPR) repeat protein